MAEILRYYDPGATGNNDGTSQTDAYTSLTTGLATEATDLVTAGDYIRFICSNVTGVEPQEAVLITSDWTTGPDNYISIEADAGYEVEESGYDVSKAILRYNYSGDVITTAVPYVYISGMHIYKSSSSNSYKDLAAVNLTSAGEVRFKNCRFTGVFSGTATNNNALNFYTNTTDTYVYLDNCIIEGMENIDDATTYPNYVFAGGTTTDSYIYAYNCIIAQNDQLDDGNATVFPVNSTVFDYNANFTSTANQSNCASPDGTGTDPVTITDWSVIYQDYSNGDFTLLSTASALDGAGLGPDSDSNVPTEDFDGTTRSGTTCTIGIIEYDFVTQTWTITYNGNGNDGGTAPTDPSSPYDDGSIVTVLGNTGTLALTGSVWSGWNTATDGSGTHYDEADTFAISADTILYAEWTESTITGTTYDNDLEVLPSCQVSLFSYAGSGVYAYVNTTTSDATTGSFSFDVSEGAEYMVVAFNADTPNVFDCSDSGLVYGETADLYLRSQADKTVPSTGGIIINSGLNGGF
ncbi:MAG: hypothetical protein PQJ59_16430 [Spirochaetales bacterium]|nr:hypothetical protein [Spirochaetales bacterium]